jgi:hypothetical protein
MKFPKFNWFISEKVTKYHWYSVKFLYKTKTTNKLIFDFTNQVGYINQADILDHRIVKKTVSPVHMMNRTKSHLCNGILINEIICYLGYFSKNTKK